MSREISGSPHSGADPLPPFPDGGRAHPIVYIDYRIRIVGYVVSGAAVMSTFLEHRPGAREATTLMWLLMGLQTLLWPHIAFLIARRSPNAQRTEKYLLAIDGLIGGVWLSLIGLALWPATVGTFTLVISAMSIGGARMTTVCLAALAAGGAITAGLAGFAFTPDTGLVTSLICMFGILAYGATYAATLRRQARSIIVADQEKAALFDEVQQRSRALASSLQRLEALHEVTKAISSSIDLQVVLDTVVRHAVRVAGADAGAIVEVETGATVFRRLASRNLSPEFLARMAKITVDPQDRVIREAIDEKKPVQVPDLELDQRFLLREAAVADGFHGFLAVPIVQERITRGLMLLRRAPGAFDDDSVELLIALAAQAAVAIENAGLYRQLQTQQHSLEVASRAKSDFMANMSHELRTPLNAILGYTELILDQTYGEVPAKIQPVLARVDRSARHLLSMIDEVLDIAKIEAGKLRLQLAPCVLSDLIRDVLISMEALAQERGLRLKVSLPAEEMPPLIVDERQLSQVLFNLVGNAIKYTEQGEVEVSATFDCQRLLVAVRDTGTGIAAADRARIFEEFEQGERSPTAPKDGAGLGLAIARRIVALHGGELTVAANPGGGSIFSFSLPFGASVAEAAAGRIALERVT